ncbi:MAG: right-handed parallel beta-helix repeat-containing protein [Candidatus Methanoperedens sp.]|nr:right-handed parallel beta-helix repeat-containing protein [Candidatus Methanoperedens sp.]
MRKKVVINIHRERALRIAFVTIVVSYILLAGSASSMSNSSSRIGQHYGDAAIYNIGRTLTDYQTSGLSRFGAEMARTDGLPIPYEEGLLEKIHMFGRLEANGTHFEIKNSSYLNVTLDSSEPINLTLESAPEMVTMHIETASGAASAKIILGGFLPQTTYHKYEDDYHNHTAFTTDANGNYSYTQHISNKHLIFIQPRPSTKFINDNATGGDCTSIGTWNSVTKICTLTTDLTETVQIDSDGITLDGSGHIMTGSDTGNGIFLSGKSGVTIKYLNVKKFYNGFYLYSSSNNTIRDNNASNNSYGISLSASSNNTINGNNASNNAGGISIEGYGNNTINGNKASNNSNGMILLSYGIHIIGSSYNTINGNNASNNNYYGIYMDGSSYNTIGGNIANINSYGDIKLYYSSSNTISGNNAGGISLSASSSNTISGNVGSIGLGPIQIFSSNNNTISGNAGSIGITSSSYNTISGNNASNNYDGIVIDSARFSSSYNTISGNNASNNGNCGIGLYSSYTSSSRYNTISGNIASNNGNCGIGLYSSSIYSSSNNNQIYNNYFNNSNNFAVYDYIYDTWNTPKTPGSNIAGGSFLGGNLWSYPNGTGFSQTCSDVNSDGFCDEPYVLDANNTDYLPLAQIPYPVHNINKSTNYTTIQAAINDASPGDEIHVDSGTYYENVDVNKQLILLGVGYPVVNGGGSGNDITLSADGSTLEGFTVTNANNGIYINASNNMVKGNKASTNADSGIEISADFAFAQNNTLIDNFVSNNSIGIFLYGYGGLTNPISPNNNNLINNTASNNNDGFFLVNARNTILIDNKATYNTKIGIYIISINTRGGYFWFVKGNNNLSYNTVSNNDIGINLLSENETLFDNKISNNTHHGIYLDNSLCDRIIFCFAYNGYNDLIHNTISNNGNGIYVNSSMTNNVKNNSVLNNNNGIILNNSNSNLIYNNDFSNLNNANDRGNNIWNSTYPSGGNYWSDYTGADLKSGPSQNLPDRDGIGDTPYPIPGGNSVDRYPLMAPSPTGIPVESSTGRGIVYFDTATGTVQDLTAVNPGDIPETPPLEANLDYGLFRFNITGIAPGGSATLTLTFPNDLPASTTYWKYGANATNNTPHWNIIPSTINGNKITITLVDGGDGDDDLRINGRIMDDGGPSIPQTTYSISLSSGWNLISVPLNLTTWILGDESAVGNPLNVTPPNSLSSIYRFNSTSKLFEKSDHITNWGWWPAAGPVKFTELEPGRGYWVMAQQDCALTFTGTTPSDLDIPLKPGWNLIGWYSMNEAVLGEESVVGNPLNVTPANSLTSIYRFNSTSDLFEKSDHIADWGWWPAAGPVKFTDIEPGRGYWVMANIDAEWIMKK